MQRVKIELVWKNIIAIIATAAHQKKKRMLDFFRSCLFAVWHVFQLIFVSSAVRIIYTHTYFYCNIRFVESKSVGKPTGWSECTHSSRTLWCSIVRGWNHTFFSSPIVDSSAFEPAKIILLSIITEKRHTSDWKFYSRFCSIISFFVFALVKCVETEFLGIR